MRGRGAVAVAMAALAGGALLVTSVPAGARAPATLRAEYTFDAVDSAVVPDLTGRGHALTLSGNYALLDGPTSPVVAFAPISRASTPHVANLNPVGREFAATLVFRVPADISTLTDTPNLAQKGFFNDPGQWKMQLEPSVAAVQCRFKGTLGAALITSSVTEVDDGLWHTATCWRSKTQLGVTVDGVDLALSRTVGDIANHRPMLIGAKSLVSSTDQFTGEIDYASLAMGDGSAAMSLQALTAP